jgi:predicted membrane protein
VARLTRILAKQQLYRLSGILFLLAAVAFLFSPTKWMAAVEGAAGLALLAVSFRVPKPAPPDRRPPRLRGRP